MSGQDIFQRDLAIEMPLDLRQKISHLTGGRPILVAMASEWLKRRLPLPEEVDLPLSELQAWDEQQLAERRQHFEFALVERVNELHQPLNWAVLYLAFLNRRDDPEILRLTLDLNDYQLAEVTKELKSMLFVRQSISSKMGLLHDEAQHLILRHLWPLLDPEGAIRREIAQQVIDEYYRPEIERSSNKDQRQRELQIECLDYHFRVDIESGWRYLDQLIAEAENSHDAHMQMNAIEQGMRNLYLEWLDPVRFQKHMARIRAALFSPDSL